MKKYIALILCFVSTFAFAGNNSLEVINSKVVPHKSVQGASYIEGDAINNSDRMISHAFIHINLYKGKSLVGNVATTVSNFPSKQVWHFKAGTTDEFDRYQIVKVTAYN